MNAVDRVAEHLHTWGDGTHVHVRSDQLLVDLPTRDSPRTWAVTYLPGARAEVSTQEWSRLQENAGRRAIVAHDFVDPKQAERYRERRIPYVDTVGNAWIQVPGLHVWVEGRRPLRPEPATKSRAFTRAGAAVTFVLLAREDFVERPVREIATAAKVSLGTAHHALTDLGDQRFLAGGLDKRSGLRNHERLLTQWVATFASRLLPSLRSRHLSGPSPDVWRRLATDEALKVVVAGEANHPALIRPTTTTLYGEFPWTDATRVGRLRRIEEEEPNVILREYFWNSEELELGEKGQLLLDYAELFSSDDSRQREVAGDLKVRFLG